MKLALILCLLIQGCVIKEREVLQLKTLPPKIIEKIYIIVPDSAVPKNEPSEVEKNKEAQKFAISPHGEATGLGEI